VPDVFTESKRSEVMSRIRGRGNKQTEVALAKLLRARGIKGWRRHLPVFGRPDFVFRERKVAIFVDGCFWHGCPKHSNMPANNRAFWQKKLTSNRRRDALVTKTLRRQGWRVLRIWEHDLSKDPDHCIERIQFVLSLGRSSAFPHIQKSSSAAQLRRDKRTP
jgi:DNA mismatch endonuclease (patch repair protein)